MTQELSGAALFDHPAFERALKTLYLCDGAELRAQVRRYEDILSNFLANFGESSPSFFSCPGRTEISGNHTDHNGGKVLTASVTMDAVAAASKTSSNLIVIISKGFREPFEIDLDDLSVRAYESGTVALVRGICAAFVARGRKVGGLNIYVSSDILFGSGLSSSAAFEMLIGAILNNFYNDNKIEKIELAKIGQEAENRYWSKPSGLLDQMGCGVGGMLGIDFADPSNIIPKPVRFNFEESGYSLVFVHPGGNHADLTDEYAKIPQEMWSVAKVLGKERLADVKFGEFLDQIPTIRKEVGDRAVLRAFHFFEENERVEKQIKALEAREFSSFLRHVIDSGNSSWRLLQNCFDIRNPGSQPIPLALAMTKRFYREGGFSGACRVHGGGFAGVILVIIPTEKVPEYRSWMAPIFGESSILALGIRSVGVVGLTEMVTGAS